MASHFPQITITFPNPINVSVQVGDTAYYMANSQALGTHTHSNQSDIVQIGEIIAIDQATNTITCFWNPNPASASPPLVGTFIMFSKDNEVNLSSMLGYYAEIKFKNNSPNKAELFSVGCEIFESSK
jgi:hypothetical protein